MQLKPTSFYAVFPDGLVLLNGHEFNVDGRRLVVHKTRPGNLDWDKNYKVSEATVGFAIPIDPTRNRLEAVKLAMEYIRQIDDNQWLAALEAATRTRATLKVIGGA